jgi:3-phosphoshikimate 1-carboxyvinyltransferase
VTAALRLFGPSCLRGTLEVPGDKSISHRALLFNALAGGSATIRGLLDSSDVKATARCLGQMGIPIANGRVHGQGGTLCPPSSTLDCGNSGTTARLLMGALAPQSFPVLLDGDYSLRRRPMGRVTEPLGHMGARFPSGSTGLPLTIHGGSLVNGIHRSPVASAQVKTALLLASLSAKGTFRFQEPTLSRDHSERMLSAMGIEFDSQRRGDGAHVITLEGGQRIAPVDISVPGDVSSAAFFMVAASICPGSDLTILNVGLNPTRSGVIDVLLRMGAALTVEERDAAGGEPVGDIRVRHSALCATDIEGDEIPRLIDEIPVLAVAAAHAVGTTRIREAGELRVKESDRIKASVALCRQLGVDADESENGFSVEGGGPGPTLPANIDATGDHRVAMASAVASLASKGETHIRGHQSVASSFPNFFQLLESVRA